MAYTAAALRAAAAGIAALGNNIGFHTADPGTDGLTGEVAGTGRPATTWPSTGPLTGTQVSAPIPGGTAVSHWSLWSSGGTFIYGGPLAGGTETFGSAGFIQHTPTLTVTNP